MSGFVSEPPRSDEQLEQATFDHEYSLSPHGQRHDRMPSHSLSAREDMTSGIANDNEEISAGQKVLSAMSGSLLTSLLCMPSFLSPRPCLPSNFFRLHMLLQLLL